MAWAVNTILLLYHMSCLIHILFLMMKIYRISHGKKSSNIVWSHGQLTIPRHLRDIVITEYGIAALKGKSDEDVIKSLIEISDSEFQSELI